MKLRRVKWAGFAVIVLLPVVGCKPGNSDPNAAPVITDETQYQATLDKARQLSMPYIRAFSTGDNLDSKATADLTEARKQFDALIAYQPTNFAPHVGSGKISYILGDLDRAKASLTQALALFPDKQSVDVRVTFAGVNDDLANVMFLTGDVESARKLSAQALDIQPDNPNFLATKASLLMNDKKIPEARKAVVDGLNIDPDNLRLQRLKRLIDSSSPAK